MTKFTQRLASVLLPCLLFIGAPACNKKSPSGPDFTAQVDLPAYQAFQHLTNKLVADGFPLENIDIDNFTLQTGYIDIDKTRLFKLCDIQRKDWYMGGRIKVAVFVEGGDQASHIRIKTNIDNLEKVRSTGDSALNNERSWKPRPSNGTFERSLIAHLNTLKP